MKTKPRYQYEQTEESLRFFSFRTPKQQQYIREYHSNYKKDPVNQYYYEGLSLIRQVLKAKKDVKLDTWCAAYEAFGCTPEVLKDYLDVAPSPTTAVEVDHIVPAAFFRKYPKYAKYMHRFYNLQVVDKVKNRSSEYMAKSKLAIRPDGSIDWNNVSPAIAFIVTRIKLDYLKDQIESLSHE